MHLIFSECDLISISFSNVLGVHLPTHFTCSISYFYCCPTAVSSDVSRSCLSYPPPPLPRLLFYVSLSINTRLLSPPTVCSPVLVGPLITTRPILIPSFIPRLLVISRLWDLNCRISYFEFCLYICFFISTVHLRASFYGAHNCFKISKLPFQGIYLNLHPIPSFTTYDITQCVRWRRTLRCTMCKIKVIPCFIYSLNIYF